ncbi:GNAT family N-acetyltransferase [Jonesia quinghaiensis]|uniref:GNAT family N-acetyltransferase n=1 Tax=Jonesia quinghaiensis TaxID=262806 RepID=UPI0003F6195A|nr:GNAT family N-acetyltransferase [Jonesia quinghaiensis]
MTDLLQDTMKHQVTAATLRLTQWMAPAAVALRQEAADELCRRYQVEAVDPDPDGDSAVAMIVLSGLVEGNRVDVGSAALIDVTGKYQQISEPVVEIKRVFVREEFRGNGFSKMLLEEIERQARAYSQRPEKRGLRLVLETGVEQPEAVALYEKLGYTRIPGYGYRDEQSVFFEVPLQ